MHAKLCWPKAIYNTTLAAICAMPWITTASADTLRSECGYSSAAGERPQTTSACTFSQRQGYIGIRIDGGAQYDFSPIGDNPGNYRDGKDDPVYRLSGLGKQGQLFKLPDRYLHVYWNPALLECKQDAISSEGQCALTYGQISFNIHASQGSSLNQLRVQPQGLSIVNDEVQVELDGSAYRAELADLDGNGWPEVYVYVSSAGSGSYGSLAAWAVNNGKSLSPIYLPPLEQFPGALEGYMGHDEFAVVENRLVRRYPLYEGGDTNASASGGTRQVQYRLEPGEAGWILVPDRMVDY